MPYTQSQIDEEQAHFANVIETFRHYVPYSLAANNRRRKDLFTLPFEDRELLEGLGYKQKLSEVDKAIRANGEFLSEIVKNPEIFGHDADGLEDGEDVNVDEARDQVSRSDDETMTKKASGHPPHSHSHGDHSNSHSHSHDHASNHSHSHSHPPADAHRLNITSTGRKKPYRPTDFDMDKLRSTLKQFVRDWSEEGKAEREAAYKPMKDALLAHFENKSAEERSKLRVLVPGAGLGRLAWDIASLGFACQGNEFSHYMLLSSYFILNRTDKIDKYKIYPYVHSFSNVKSKTALLRPISIPDVMPSALPPGSNFSLVAGDFEEIYGAEDEDDELEPHSGQWDAIMTCFFIDTAKNIVNYLRILHRILAPGGVWINLGPLLWHFENNSTNDPSIELDLEEVKTLAWNIGFEISNEKTISTTYVNNKESMLGYVYEAAFWTATKKL
ncbi:hypothetical protein JAAARDRAFT_194531 [Jaapia argillacea MUCL 33604]|uniref:carnosine N-methyltransferase n=1 Tax=Jaapia argillacea MUCL 33604 TaxID=933084 RepID=A0A067PP30_9AGAM|nr:hypothetical protein JAAARDRAFT_194531 [Jaapia argillacea MUCL 33604]